METKPTMTYVYVAIAFDGHLPVAVSESTLGIEDQLAEYTKGQLISFEAHNPKYPDDFQGWYTYEDVDGEGVVFKLYTVNYK